MKKQSPIRSYLAIAYAVCGLFWLLQGMFQFTAATVLGLVIIGLGADTDRRASQRDDDDVDGHREHRVDHSNVIRLRDARLRHAGEPAQADDGTNWPVSAATSGDLVPVLRPSVLSAIRGERNRFDQTTLSVAGVLRNAAATPASMVDVLREAFAEHDAPVEQATLRSVAA